MRAVERPVKYKGKEVITMTDKTTPVHEVRLGAMKSAVWEHLTDQDYVRYNTTVQRLYKGEDDKWNSTNSFGRDDLPLVMKVADRAHTWILEQHQRKDAPAD